MTTWYLTALNQGSKDRLGAVSEEGREEGGQGNLDPGVGDSDEEEDQHLFKVTSLLPSLFSLL